MSRALTGNEMWIVSYVKWSMRRNGIPEIHRTYSRAFRGERDAKRQYRAIKNSLIDGGFRLSDITEECRNECEGVRGSVRVQKEARNSTLFIFLYLIRNEPLYD